MNKEQKEKFLELNDRYYYWIGWEDEISDKAKMEFLENIADNFRGLLLNIYNSEENQ